MTARTAKSPIGWLLGLLLTAGGVAATPLEPAPLSPSALEPASTGGVELVDRALAKLSTHTRLLLVAAHPDDEDTGLLAYVARALGGEAAYLSLSRGEGGQNFIGPELGVALGLIRTGELAAAREVDGARQYFGRTYDFGYTRSLEETLGEWPREVIVEDTVRAIRRFRPQVLISTFTPEFGGHGQHVAAGVASFDAFELAGDPEAFPHLEDEGLLPWSPEVLYRSTWFDREATTAIVPTGILDPLSGRSIHQIAMESRSLHRSQNMGRLQEMGPRASYLGWVAGGAAADRHELFAGIDRRLRALADPLPPGEPREVIRSLLDRVEERAKEARKRLPAGRPEGAVAALAEILTDLRTARLTLGDDPGRSARIVDELLTEKEKVAERALLAAAGVAIDGWATRETVTPGGRIELSLRLWNAGGQELLLHTLEARIGDSGSDSTSSTPPAPVAPGELFERELTFTVGKDQPVSIPYFLRRPLDGSVYGAGELPPRLQGLPFDPPLITLRVELELAGHRLTLEREAIYRHLDPGLGEVRRPLRVVPRLEVEVDPPLAVLPVDGREPIELQVTIRSHATDPVAGRIVVAGWEPAPEPLPIEIPEPGGIARAKLSLDRPAAASPGPHSVRVRFEDRAGGAYEKAFPLIQEEHIRPVLRPVPALARIRLAELEWPPLTRLGYIRGASDLVPEALLAAGLPLELLEPEELWRVDLTDFDALLVGPRAFEIEPALAPANPLLLDFVRSGGLLIVQYQQYPYIRGGFAPYPFEIDRPHDRVTDPAAPVEMLVPDHPVLTSPNRLGAADWRGWVQERGLYFAARWDEAYEPLVGIPDHTSRRLDGGLLVAPHGDGIFVYTGLALFRQIPEGVPGAYRLLANLLALGDEGERAGTGDR